MKIDNFNKWLTLIANLGVVAGLLFLGLELQQSSRITERELAISRADNVHGTFVNNEFLSEAVLKVSNVQGMPAIVEEYAETFQMSEIEAYRYWRYIFQLWEYEQAEWNYRGRPPEDCELELLGFLDHQIFFREMQGYLDNDFSSCINTWYQT